MAFTERYVTTTGAGAHDGTSEANAYSWTEMVTAINGGDHAGYRYNIKQGTYSLSADDTLTGDGSATAPCIIRGYKTTIGDATLGRSTTGALDTSNMPTIAYVATKRLDAAGAAQIVYEALVFTGNVAYHLCHVGTSSIMLNCSLTNASTNAAATCVGANGADMNVIGCDCDNAGSTASPAIACSQSFCVVHSCRVTSSGYGIATSSSGSGILINNVVYGCPTAGIYIGSSSRCFPMGNTIYDCGNGVEVQSGSTSFLTAVGNHVTDCSGYAFDYNANTNAKVRVKTRTRDLTSGVEDTSGDWNTGCNYFPVTTDNGAASSDYTDAGAGDFTLVAAAAGLGAGLQPYSDIGAVGAVRASAGGGVRGSLALGRGLG